MAKIGPLVEVHQRRDSALVELERLDEVRAKVFKEGGWANIKQVHLPIRISSLTMHQTRTEVRQAPLCNKPQVILITKGGCGERAAFELQMQPKTKLEGSSLAES